MQEPDTTVIDEHLTALQESNDKFTELLYEVDRLITADKQNPLEAVENRFRRADILLANESKTGVLSAHRARFDLDVEGRVVQLSPLAVTQLNLFPGSLFVFGGKEAEAVFKKLVTGAEKQALISVPTPPFGKPVLINLYRKNKKTIEATALSMAWLSIAEGALREQFSLSEAEADIAHLIFDGAVPKDVARVRNSSVETVRKQIRSLLSKTGARSLTDLLHILYSFVGEADQLGLSSRLFPERTMIRLRDDTVYDVMTEGDKNARPLLFIHGALGGRQLHPLARSALADRFIISPGRPFHGQSRTDSLAATGQQIVAEDLKAICDHFAIEEMDIVAYNTGVAYALTLAQLIPERIKRAVFISPTPSITSLRDIMAMRHQERVFLLATRTSQATAKYLARAGGKKLVNDGPDGFAATVFAGMPADIKMCQSHSQVKDLFWRGHSWHTEQGPEGFISDIMNSNTHWQEGLTQLPMKISYVLGDKDMTILPVPFESLVNTTGGQVITVKDVGLSILHANPQAWLNPLLSD